MHPKEEEQFIAGSIDAMRRLNLAAGEARGMMQQTCRVSVRDVELVLSSTKKISAELLRYRVTSKEAVA